MYTTPPCSITSSIRWSGVGAQPLTTPVDNVYAAALVRAAPPRDVKVPTTYRVVAVLRILLICPNPTMSRVHGSVAPVDGSTRPKLLRGLPLMSVNAPPMYTWLPAWWIENTSPPPTVGAHGRSTPAVSTAAR